MDYDDVWVDQLIFGTKICSTCGAEWPRNSEHFQRDASRDDGLTSACRKCRREQSSKTYHANPQRYIDAQRRRRAKV